MARFRADEADNYGGNGGHGFFSLSNDGDVARVRFLYDSIDDVAGYAVHQVEVDGKKRYVNCLRNYNDPIDMCPFCKEKMFQIAKLYIPVYDVDTEEVKIWERGKKFLGKLSSLCARYPHLVSHEFEIERHGKKGDTGTTYEIYEVGHDEKTLEDFPELPEIVGGIVLDKSADEMDYYLDHGEFPKKDNSTDAAVSRRRHSDYEESPRRDEIERRSSRRTPSRSRSDEAF